MTNSHSVNKCLQETAQDSVLVLQLTEIEVVVAAAGEIQSPSSFMV